MMTDLLGTRISHYRFVDFLGEGGMGQVYAGYDEKLDRKVALKSIRADRRLIAEAKTRFLREARVLSQLAHPNICQIFDYIEGDTGDFLVLELILGHRLTLAIRKGMDFKRKLKIAEQIAGVLVVAHEKDITHRDLKPDNIMLAEGDQVKVLDFGLSRSRQDESTLIQYAKAGKSTLIQPSPHLPAEAAPSRDTGKLTIDGAIMGTIGYMSPEQARGEEATTAADLYSFGLILQEMFTGKAPYEAAQNSAAMLEKAQTGHTLPAEGIDADLAALIERLKSPAPAARPSAVDTAERLAWIRNKPARRRKKFLLAAAMGVLALFGLTMTLQTIRATRAEKIAEEEAAISRSVSDFLTRIFQVSDPSEARGNSVTAKEILDSGAGMIESELKDRPLLQARMMLTMGNVYRNLGLYQKAELLTEKSLQIREQSLGPDHADTGESLNALAILQTYQGRFAESEANFKRALAVREKTVGPDHPETAETLNNLANVFNEQARYEEAEPVFKRALAIVENAHGPEHRNTTNTLHNLASLYRNQERFAEAESLQKRVVAINEKALGFDHPETAVNRNNLAGLYLMQGKFAEAEPLFKDFIAYCENVFGPEHPNTAASLNNLAGVYNEQGKFEDAEPLFKRALAIAEKTLGSDHPDVAEDLHNLAGVFTRQARYAEAEPLFNRAIAIREKTLGPDHPDTAVSQNNLATLYQQLGKNADAEPLFRSSFAVFEKTFGPEHPNTAASLLNLARICRDTNRYKEAESSFIRALEIWEKALGKEHPLTVETMKDYARLLRKLNRDGEAAALEAKAKTAMESRTRENK